MKPDIVVDIGNTRMKWGWCRNGCVNEITALGDDVAEWDQAVENHGRHPLHWAIVSVHPERLNRFVAWIKSKNHTCDVIGNRLQIPLDLRIDEPDSVGLDRLCASLAALALHGPGPLLVVQAGTTIVLNLISDRGEFRGGAILPGFRLMARSLIRGTAQLPEVEFTEPASILPGENTSDAIRSGIYWSIAGAVIMLRSSYSMAEHMECLRIILTGGDAHLLEPELDQPVIHVPELTLEGIRLAAEAMP